MPIKYVWLVDALEGYKRTGLWLLGFDGTKYYPSAAGDDVGIFFFIPLIAMYLHIDMHTATNIFLLSFLSLSCLVAMVGFYLLFDRVRDRIVALIGLCIFLLFIFHNASDVYLIASSAVVAFVPLFLFFLKRKPALLPHYLGIISIPLATMHFIRAYSEVGIVIFIIISIFFYLKVSMQRKVLLTGVLLVGFIPTVLFFTYHLDQRDVFLLRENPDHVFSIRKHGVWQPFYLGLGYIPNQYGIEFANFVAIKKVDSIVHGVDITSARFEDIMREEAFAIIKHDPFFYIKTLLAKSRRILFFMLITVNVAILSFMHQKKPRAIEIAFLAGILFNSLYGFIAIPTLYYLSGMIAFGIIYWIVSMPIVLDYIKFPRANSSVSLRKS